MSARATLHATCVLLGEVGVLVTGPSGAGKSTLARALIERGGRLVGDDRVRLEVRHGRLVARGHPALAGRIEVFGVGPVAAPLGTASALVRLLVALGPGAPRLPEAETETVLGVALLRIALPAGPGRVDAVLWRARAIRDMMMTP